MTPYRERREAGEYDAPDAAEQQGDDTEDNGSSGSGTTLAELKEQAEARGLPTYGTKAQLKERLAEAEQE